MQALVEKMISDFERGVLSRRQLAATLTGLAAVAAVPPALAAPSLKAITLNHVTVKVPDLQKTSKFYQEFFGMKLAQQSKTIHILSVGESFFGIEEKPGPAGLDHYDFGLQGWDAKAMRAKVAAHGLAITPGSRGDDESFKFNDPDGFVVQVNGPKYTGHVGADVPQENMTLARKTPMKFSLALIAAAALSALPALAADQTQIFSTERSAVRITPIYHASLKITAGRDIIYIDPAKPAKIDGMGPGDLILITDIHGDHMDPADVTALSKTTTTVIAPAAVAKTITQATVLANGESRRWRDWNITAVPMYNINHNQPSGQPYHDKGRGNGYVLNYGGRNFYFAGDTEGVPEMRALKKIDVAFIPMNLPYTMTPAEAADAVKAFHPKIAIPYHYNGQDIEIFKKALDGSGIEVRLLDWYPK